MPHLPLIIQSFLDAGLRERIVDILLDGDLKWELQNDKGRASRGESFQLERQSKDQSLAFQLVARTLAERCILELRSQRLLQENFTPTAYQVFPVLMRGSKSNPPHQLAHRDNYKNADGQTALPLMVCVYYAKVDNTQGGELVCYSSESKCDSVGEFVHTPSENELICFEGSRLHSVSILTKGTRLSVVVDLFDVATPHGQIER